MRNNICLFRIFIITLRNNIKYIPQYEKIKFRTSIKTFTPWFYF